MNIRHYSVQYRKDATFLVKRISCFMEDTLQQNVSKQGAKLLIEMGDIALSRITSVGTSYTNNGDLLLEIKSLAIIVNTKQRMVNSGFIFS